MSMITAARFRVLVNDEQHEVVITLADQMRAEREGVRLDITRGLPSAFTVLCLWSACKAAGHFDPNLPAEVFLTACTAYEELDVVRVDPTKPETQADSSPS